MEKRDYKKDRRWCYKAAQKLEMVNVPAMNFLMIDGTGDPNTSASFGEAIEALYSVAYTLKFAIKRGPQKVDFGVLPLEALWWADDMATFKAGDKDSWRWTAMIMQPPPVTAALFEELLPAVVEKKGLAALQKIRFETFCEGLAVQTLHKGPFSEEGPTIEKIHDFIASQGWQLSGKHHEIYLTDMRRAAPENWKTILRQPYR